MKASIRHQADFDSLAEAISPDQLAASIGAKKAKGGSYHCPNEGGHSHSDRTPSLSISSRENRTVALCHGCGLKGSPVQVAAQLWSTTPADAAERLATSVGLSPAAPVSNAGPRIAATYAYRAEDGELLFEVVREEPKRFWQRRPDGNGGWIHNVRDTRRVLFRLPQVLEGVALDKEIWICEGEKDVLAMEKAGAVATCNPMGAGKWRPEYSESIRGARVKIVADRDDKGIAHAQEVAQALDVVASSVAIVQARHGKDAADHLASGFGLEDFEPLRGGAEENEVERLFNPREIRFERFLLTDPPALKWIVRDVIAERITGLLAALGGGGKSMLAYLLGFSVATGLPFLGMPMGDPGAFLYLAAEDDEGELHRRGLTLLNHFEGLESGLELSGLRESVGERLHVLSRVAQPNLLTHLGSDGEVHQTPLVTRIIEAASRIPDLRLIVLDPVSRFRGGRANSEEDATRFVEALECIRAGTGATVLGLAHVSQAGMREGGGQEIVRGSTALVDGVRFVATLQRMRPDRAKDYGVSKEEARRYLQLDVPKNNYAPPFEPMWIRREAGGVLVPAQLEERAVLKSEERSEAVYARVLPAVQALIGREGPLTATSIETVHAGLHGPLGAGGKAVRGVIAKALLRGDLVEAPNPGRGGGHLLLLPGEDA